MAGDITMRSALTANGSACPNAAHTDGAVLLRDRLDEEKEASQALGRRTMSPGGCGCGSWRPMEHGVCGFCDSSRGVQVPRSTSTVEGFGLLCLAAKMDEDVVHFVCKVVCELAGLDPIPHARRAGWVGG